MNEMIGMAEILENINEVRAMRHERAAEIERIADRLQGAIHGSLRPDAMLAMLLVLSAQLDDAAENTSPNLHVGFLDLRLQVNKHINAAMDILGLKWAMRKVPAPAEETEPQKETEHEKHCHQRRGSSRKAQPAAPGTKTTAP